MNGASLVSDGYQSTPNTPAVVAAASVPEPGTGALAAAASVALGAVGFRKARTRPEAAAA